MGVASTLAMQFVSLSGLAALIGTLFVLYLCSKALPTGAKFMDSDRTWTGLGSTP